jgi:hypothetical protein
MSELSGKSGGNVAVRQKSPSLLNFLLVNASIGSAVAVLVVAGLILTDTHSLGRLILSDQDPVIAVVLLTFGFVVTLGSVAMGTAIMGMAYTDDVPPSGRRDRVKAIGPRPSTVNAVARR